MAKRKAKKKVEVNFVKDYLEAVKENVPASMEAFEEGLRAAEKKQKEYEHIGRSETKLAENITLEFHNKDEEYIKEKIDEVKRKFGLLQDEKYHEMIKNFTPYGLKHFEEDIEEIMVKKRKYHISYSKRGICSSIGSPNLDVLAKFIFEHTHNSGLGNLSADTQTSLFFNKMKSL